MNKKIILLFIIVLAFVAPFFTLAETYTITVRGEPRTPDGKIDLMYDAGAMLDQVKFENKTTINNDEGYFEVKDISFEAQRKTEGGTIENVVNVYAAGDCFYYVYNIIRKGDHFEVVDAYAPENGPVILTKSNYIDLGVLTEDRSSYINVDSDIPLNLFVKDSNGISAFEKSGYAKYNGGFNAFKPHSTYTIYLTDKNGKQWVKTINTGDYCESTRIIKRGNYFLIENFSNNSLPRIRLFSDVWLSILGFRLIAVIPILIILILIIVILFLSFRKRH